MPVVTTEWLTADEAGQRCTPPVPARTWRLYVDRSSAPQWRRRNPTTGVQEWDAAEVERWIANRPGPGRRSLVDGARARRTPARHRVLDAASRGQVIDRRPSGGQRLIAGEPLARAEAQAATELVNAKYLATLSTGRLRLTAAGWRLLREWGPYVP